MNRYTVSHKFGGAFTRSYAAKPENNKTDDNDMNDEPRSPRERKLRATLNNDNNMMRALPFKGNSNTVNPIKIPVKIGTGKPLKEYDVIAELEKEFNKLGSRRKRALKHEQTEAQAMKRGAKATIGGSIGIIY